MWLSNALYMAGFSCTAGLFPMPTIKTSLESVLKYRCSTLVTAFIVIDRGVPKPLGVLWSETYCNKAMVAQTCKDAVEITRLHPVIRKVRVFNMLKS